MTDGPAIRRHVEQYGDVADSYLPARKPEVCYVTFTFAANLDTFLTETANIQVPIDGVFCSVHRAEPRKVGSAETSKQCSFNRTPLTENLPFGASSSFHGSWDIEAGLMQLSVLLDARDGLTSLDFIKCGHDLWHSLHPCHPITLIKTAAWTKGFDPARSSFGWLRQPAPRRDTNVPVDTSAEKATVLACRYLHDGRPDATIYLLQYGAVHLVSFNGTSHPSTASRFHGDWSSEGDRLDLCFHHSGIEENKRNVSFAIPLDGNGLATLDGYRSVTPQSPVTLTDLVSWQMDLVAGLQDTGEVPACGWLYEAYIVDIRYRSRQTA
jgi:hypothetical protein